VTTRSLDARETADVGDTVISFSEAKALATRNPLLIDKADADLTRLTRAERAHHRNATALRHAITRHQQNITSLNQLTAQIDTAITDADLARREIDHATQALGRPFPHAAELAAARDLVNRIEEQLAQLAAAHQPDMQNEPPSPTPAPEMRDARELGPAPKLPAVPSTELTLSRVTHRRPNTDWRRAKPISRPGSHHARRPA
jgi:hypothetical protein